MHEQQPKPEVSQATKTERVLAATALLATLPSMAAGAETTTYEKAAPIFVDSKQPVPELPADPSELIIQVPGVVANKHQRDFETDSDDKETSQNQVDALLEAQLQPGEWDKVMRIEIIGRASAEDEATDQGLQQPSTENQELAQQRGELTKEAVLKTFNEHGVDVSGIVETSALENTWTDDELEQGDALAKQFGYTDAAAMVEAYNIDPASVTPEVSDFLHPLLDARRGATILLTLPGSDGGFKKKLYVPMDYMTGKIGGLPPTEATHDKVNDVDVVGYIPSDQAAEPASQKSTRPVKTSKGSSSQTVVMPMAPNPEPVPTYDTGKKPAPYLDSKQPRQIKGQKPIRHRGRTHMTGPRW